jgi:hypothetical protein
VSPVGRSSFELWRSWPACIFSAQRREAARPALGPRSITEYGLCADGALEPISLQEPWTTDERGKVTGFMNAQGAPATAAEVRADALAWEQSFSRDARALQCQSHDHDCKATCAKYAPTIVEVASGGAASAAAPEPKRRRKFDPREHCRFLCVPVVALTVLRKLKSVLRRGKELVQTCIVCSNERHFGFWAGGPRASSPECLPIRVHSTPQ